MIAQTQLSRNLQKNHDQVWPLTKYQANSRTRHWEYPWVITQIEDYKKENKIDSYSDLRIIEMGAANSCLQFFYAKKGVNYTSIDLSDEVFDKSIAQRLGVKINYKVGLFEEVIVKKKYDLMLCVSVIEHSRPENKGKILKNIAKVLKTKGRAVFTIDWFFDHKIRESCQWGYNLNCKELIGMAKDLGLRLLVGEKKYLSGFAEFNEKEIKKDAFVLKVCNRGVWLTSLAFVLEKMR